MNERDRIMSRLPQGGPSAIPAYIEAVSADPPDWARFQERLELLGGRVIEPAEALRISTGAVWADKDVPAWVPKSNCRLWEAEVGVTTADWAVEETGSLLLTAGPGRMRLASLAPPIHLCIVKRDRLARRLAEIMGAVEARTSVLITGTSRTADIEGILVRGVHGPRELLVVVEP